MTGEQHQAVVAALASQGAQTEKFGRAIRRLWREVQGPPNDAQEFFSQGNFRRVPDAYRIDREAKIVTIYEVVVGSPISRDKASDYYSLIWMLDEEYWTLDVIEVNEHGKMRRLDALGRGIDILRDEMGLPPLTASQRAAVPVQARLAMDPYLELAPP